jgi:hypothetical protein
MSLSGRPTSLTAATKISRFEGKAFTNGSVKGKKYDEKCRILKEIRPKNLRQDG